MPQRKAPCELGNQAAAVIRTSVKYIVGGAVRSIQAAGHKLRIAAQTTKGGRSNVVGEFVACYGFKPYTSIAQELRSEQRFASEDP